MGQSPPEAVAGIKDHPFTRGFRAEHLDAIRDHADHRSYRAGQYLWRQGQPADSFCLVLSGEIAIEIAIPLQGVLRIEIVQSGGALGWSWLVAPHRWQFDVRALSDTHVAILDGARLREMCDRDSAFGYALLKNFTPMLGHRLHATRARLLESYGIAGPRMPA